MVENNIKRIYNLIYLCCQFSDQKTKYEIKTLLKTGNFHVYLMHIFTQTHKKFMYQHINKKKG